MIGDVWVSAEARIVKALIDCVGDMMSVVGISVVAVLWYSDCDADSRIVSALVDCVVSGDGVAVEEVSSTTDTDAD